MKFSGHRQLLCVLSTLNAFNFLGYQTNTDASILVYESRPERIGFNMYAEYTQLTCLALVPCFYRSELNINVESKRKDIVIDNSLGLIFKLQSKSGTVNLFELCYFIHCSTLQYSLYRLKQSIRLVHCSTVQYITIKFSTVN
jgi:hypothetical protein